MRSPGRTWLSTLLLALLIGAGCTRGDAHAQVKGKHRAIGKPRSSLGVNVGQVAYFSPQVVFLDLVKQAPDWGLGSNGELPKLDEHGYPKALKPGHAAGFIAHVIDTGHFVALYEGEGEISITHGGRIVSSAPGRVEIELVPNEEKQLHVQITRTNAENHLRNLHLVPLANEKDYAQTIFHPKFLEALKPFGTLRFLDFLHVNASPVVHWSDRVKPDDALHGTDAGSSPEYAVELCNRMQADCWLLVPHKADDDYVRKLAELVRDKLDPNLLAYVEYSNEVWNFAEQGDYCQAQGVRLGMPDEWDTRLRYQAHRSIEIFKIFEKTFGGSHDRFVRVLAGQQWPLRLEILLTAENAYQHADAVAVAPYFCDEATDEKTLGKVRKMNAAELAKFCLADVERIRQNVRADKALADKLGGLPLVAYEAGQHLATGGNLHQDRSLQRKLDDANRDPNMGRAYDAYFKMWREEGGTLMNLYKLADGYSIWGRWGLLETLAQPKEAAPKYAAVMRFLQQTPAPWWNGVPPKRAVAAKPAPAAKATETKAPAAPSSPASPPAAAPSAAPGPKTGLSGALSVPPPPSHKRAGASSKR